VFVNSLKVKTQMLIVEVLSMVPPMPNRIVWRFKYWRHLDNIIAGIFVLVPVRQRSAGYKHKVSQCLISEVNVTLQNAGILMARC